jgi:hypothetical protein
MSDLDLPTNSAADAVPALREANRPARVSVRISFGNSRFQADAEISPLGLLAVGGMVGAILLAVTPIVRGAVRYRRQR